MKQKMYKTTGARGETYGGYHWPLPQKVKGKWIPGEWTTPIEGELEPCENGYHITDAAHILDWANNNLYEVEYKGALVAHDDGDKWVCRQAKLTRKIEKWNDKTLRLFACWCARNALALIEKPDPRSVDAVDVAEKFANGKATVEELAAAWDAAWDAARDAAWDAARAAAWDAARAAAWDAARDAAWDAQIEHLKEMLDL